MPNATLPFGTRYKRKYERENSCSQLISFCYAALFVVSLREKNGTALLSAFDAVTSIMSPSLSKSAAFSIHPFRLLSGSKSTGRQSPAVHQEDRP